MKLNSRQGIACGIDFGTSNSAIALSDGSNIRIAKIEGDEVTIPSALFFEEQKNSPIYGRQAIDMFYRGAQGRFMKSLKRILGTSLMDKSTVVNGTLLPFRTMVLLFIRKLI